MSIIQPPLPHGLRPPAVVERWRALLYNNLPWFGSRLRWTACKALVPLAQNDTPTAAAVLAQTLDHPAFADFALYLTSVILTLRKSGSIREIWQVFSATRPARLGELLIQIGRAAVSPPELRVLSLLWLQQEGPLVNATPDLLQPLVHLTKDSDILLAGRARYALTRLKLPKTIEIFCDLWLRSRDPQLENILAQAGYQPDNDTQSGLFVALKFNRLDRVTNCLPSQINALTTAANDADAEIQSRARFCIANLQNPATINAFCRIWAQNRSALYESALLQAGYVATKPAPLRLLTALKVGRTDIAMRVTGEYLKDLVVLCEDQDEVIKISAHNALLNLEHDDAREALCQLAIDGEPPVAAEIAQQAGYLPDKTDQRALYLFLTSQWQSYDLLDFDRRILNAVYETATAAVRQRILRSVQQSGRAEFLPILAGLDYRARAEELTPIETRLLVSMLLEHHEWEKCWLLARELSLLASIEIMRALAASGWQPAQPQEVDLFTTLADLACQPIILSAPELSELLPPAIARATLKLHGRANDIAFSPKAPELAIGASSKQIVIWDYQRGQVINQIPGFEHSVGHTVYTTDGTLICAERSAGSGLGRILICAGDQKIPIGQHSAALTALEPAGGDHILSAGRDGVVALWDTARGKQISMRSFDPWPRSVCIAPGFEQAALVHTQFIMIDLPGLTDRPERTAPRWKNGHRQLDGMAASAAFLPDSNDLLVGNHNGNLWHYQHDGRRLYPQKILQFQSRVMRILNIPNRPVILCADSGGSLVFLSSMDLSKRKQVQIPSDRLTSLHISADGAFLATGTGDSRLILWDLRPMDIPALLAAPLAASRPPMLAGVQALLGSDQLPAPVVNLLRYISVLLSYRFRFDVEMEDTATSIQTGEFDVLIDSIEN